jgi:hypothetical protein
VTKAASLYLGACARFDRAGGLARTVVALSSLCRLGEVTGP